jgi:hypothetical protein
MATGKKPGMSYEDMYALIRDCQRPATSMFSVELLIAIFWEESLFNNVPQDGGTAWGFGQTEPAEFYKVESPGPGPQNRDDPRTTKPRHDGYEVMNIPRREYTRQTVKVIKKDGTTEQATVWKARLLESLKPEQSVQITFGLLRHYYDANYQNQRAALYAYGGVGYQGTDVAARLAKPGSREAIIQGWLDCEAHLLAGPNALPKDYVTKGMYQPASRDDWPAWVKKGLYKARAFPNDPTKDTGSFKVFDDALFPKDPATGQWKPRKVLAPFLADYMNQSGLSAGVAPVPDDA